MPSLRIYKFVSRISHALAALVLSCAVWGQVQESFNLYETALAARGKQAGKSDRGIHHDCKSLQQYATCHQEDCAESLSRFASALCGLDSLDAGARHNALGQLV